jgi:hypothetical protein
MKSKVLLAVIVILCGRALYAVAGPTISSFSPNAGQVGTLVTINGTNLSSPTAFTIGGKAAIVVSNTGTQLVGMVMPGAITGAISITAGGGTANSATNFTVNPPTFPTLPVSANLIGTQSTYYSEQGTSVALSANGSTAIVGAENDNNGAGSSYVYTYSAGVWTQQTKLVGTGEYYLNYGMQGSSVALSADGNTAMVGGFLDGSTYVNTSGFIWFFTRTGTTWTQQGTKLSGTGAVIVPMGAVYQGYSVSLSADGNTAIEGGPNDNGGQGAAWIFTRSAGVWSQVGSKLVGTGGGNAQGHSVAMSSDGNTALVGSSSGSGGAYVYTRSGNNWTQQGNELTVSGSGALGASVALSADGNTALLGAPSGVGGAWVFTRSGSTWSQFGTEFTFPGGLGNSTEAAGSAVALSADGNTAVVGASGNGNISDVEGGTWVFTRSGSNFVNQGGFILGGGNNFTSNGAQGSSVALSSTGTTALVGAPTNNINTGLAFVLSAVTPSVKTNAATNVASTTANINGYITTAGLTATADFEWGTDPNLVGATTTTTFSQGTNPVAINSYNDAFSSSLTGLLPSTTYYFRIDGTNINGTANGSILSFTTPAAPPPSSVITFTLPQYATYGSTIVPTISSTDPTTPIVYRTPDETVTVTPSEQLIATAVGPTYVVAIQYITGTTTEEGHATADITITPAPLTATADDKTINWGQPAPAFTTTYNGFVNGDTPANLPYNAVPLMTTPYLTGNAAGNYYIFNGPTATGSGGNYNINYVNGTLKVVPIYPQPTALTLAPGNVGSNGATLNGAVNDNGAATTVTIQYTTNDNDGLQDLQTATLTTGPATLPAGSGNTNYAAVLTGLLPNTTYYYIITGANPEFSSTGSVESFTTPSALNSASITFNQPPSQVYGSADFAPGATSTNTVTPITYMSSNTAVATITSNGDIHIVGVGNTQITASQAAGSGYSASAPVTQTFYVTQAPLTITPNSISVVWGQPIPAYTATYTGLVNGDTPASLTTQPTFYSSAVQTAGYNPPAGTYNIQNNGAAADINYVIIYGTGTLTITPAYPQPVPVALPATAINSNGGTLNGTVTSNNAPTTVIIQYTDDDSDGLGNLQTAILTTGPGTTQSASPTTYAAILTTLQSSTKYYFIVTASNPEFTVTSNIESFITPAALQTETITFNQPPAKVYGSADVAPGATSTNTSIPITYTSSNTAVATIVNGEIHILTTGSTNITAMQTGDATHAPATSVTQTFTITPAALTITATNETKVYGQTNPYLAVSYSGFIAGDDSTRLSPQPTTTTTATKASAVGSYPITVSNAADNNYTITYKGGTLTITPAPLTITADNQTKFVGTANPRLTITYSGFAGNDSKSSLTTQPTISTTATASSQIGSYPITVSGAADNNYTITYQSGTLTVTPLLVLNPFPPKTYGDPDFNPNATGSNITYSSGNDGVATIVSGNIHITGAGSSVITASSGDVSVQQTLTINKAPLAITANDQTRPYGQANPTLTLSYDKFVYSDNASNSLSTQATVTTAATNTSDVGTYPITVTGAAANNYAITYAPGTLTITQATQSISFAPIPDQVEPSVYDLSTVTASSGLPVTFTLSDNGIAGISGTSLNSTAPGMETVTAGQPGNNDYLPAAGVAQAYTIKEPDNGEVIVSMVVSPNGDGINDVLNVINIQYYPDNRMILINRNGVKIYDARGYNNTSVVFDGHSSITGALQQQGTLLYLLEYRINGQMKRKTGFTVLRY